MGQSLDSSSSCFTDLKIRKFPTDMVDTLPGCKDSKEPDILDLLLNQIVSALGQASMLTGNAPVNQHIDGGYRCASSGDQRVQEVDQVNGRLLWKL